MTWSPPKTFADWEERLVRHFLAIGPDGDASDIRSFEVTPNTLAQACGADSDEEATVEEAFRSFMAHMPNLSHRLNIGMSKAATREWPNFFIYLLMTLLIDSQLEGHEGDNEFRRKLRKWLGTEQGFQQLPGVNLMWEALVRWLDLRVNEGQHFRRLILPEIPKNWSHIGYTLRLTFPNKTDLRLMEDFLAKCPQAYDTPQLIVRKFPVVLLDDKASEALKLAFTEFRDAYDLGRRALADLRFWRLLQRAYAHMGRSARHSVIVDMMFDVDGSRGYFSHTEQALEAELHPNLLMALNSVSAHASLNLGRAVQSGLLFFRQVGVGRWRAEARPCTAPQGLHVALTRRHEKCVGDRLGRLVKEGEWLLTSESRSYHNVYETLRLTNLLPQSSDEPIVRPRLSSGVRMPYGWLGRPAFLPLIESDATDYVIRPVVASAGDCPITMEGGQLIASAPVEGAFVIEPVREFREKVAPWRSHVQLFQDALPHSDLGSSARYRLERLYDWSRVSPALVNFEGQDALAWETGHSDGEHLLEALYASGVSGWEEAELVALLARTNVSPWLLLRCLQDGGIIEPRLRSGWKGRAWTLAEPKLVRISRPGQDLIVVEGGICAQLAKEFQQAVIGLGGQCFRRLGVGPWSPPLIGAKVAAMEDLAKKLGWPLVMLPPMPDAVPLAFAGTERMTDLHEVASTWDWVHGRFKEGSAREDTVTLTRRVHPGGRDHDLYCLTSRKGTTTWLSRTAAIAAAHSMTRSPLFEQRGDGLLVSITRDCGLPDALAAGLRRRLLRTAGPIGDEYIYPVTPQTLKWLGSLLSGCLVGQAQTNERSISCLVSETRRSGGQQRLQWRNGQLTLTRHD
ncbi:hypothetical protein [Pseudomonas sp. TE50-2]|uniref:hypothetical protein n=1 Tax=Pseudomonas sp. TE50-2 TaxID=3142707 RepID=UPI0034653FA2